MVAEIDFSLAGVNVTSVVCHQSSSTAFENPFSVNLRVSAYSC